MGSRRVPCWQLGALRRCCTMLSCRHRPPLCRISMCCVILEFASSLGFLSRNRLRITQYSDCSHSPNAGLREAPGQPSVIPRTWSDIGGPSDRFSGLCVVLGVKVEGWQFRAAPHVRFELSFRHHAAHHCDSLQNIEATPPPHQAQPTRKPRPASQRPAVGA